MTKTIIISPLNWGLGHATRCIPIINALLEQNHRVVIASDGVALELLTQEFPQLPRESIPSYNITYPETGNLLLHVLTLVPRIIQAILKEHRALKELVKKHKADVVISDNRYGMYHRHIKSIFITHQLRIPTPFGGALIASLQTVFLRRFDEIWVPDMAGDQNLSGELSHFTELAPRIKYIGVISRFEGSLKSLKPEGFLAELPFDLAVISGPEPQRTAFEKMLLHQAHASGKRFVIVGGNPNSSQNHSKGNVIHFPFLKAVHLKWMLENAQLVISRSGYTTLMDLVTLNKPAVLIPTPGQIEQEYLMHHLQDYPLFEFVKQGEFDLQKIQRNGRNRNGSSIKEAGNHTGQLKTRISTI